jgi:CRISPR-associated protein, Csy3 family
LQLSLRDFTAPTATQKGLQSLGDLITQGLAGASHVLLQVTAFARQGAAQEVYPSQELILDKDASKKSKTLYAVQGTAGIHSQKLGNALRSIDTWYSDPDTISLGPIAVEPYGSVTTLGKAFRRPVDKLDFYSLLDNWLLKDVIPPVEQQHFVMAVLVRGGVFGDSGKD